MKYRGFWLTRVLYRPEEMENFISSDERKGRRQVAAIMEELASMGTNLLYLSARHTQGLVWHKSAVETNPWGWDVLACAAEEARRCGIELHPWIVMWGDRAHNRPELHTVGRNMPHRGGYPWMCPARPESREYFQKILLEWLDGYDVDGIHFDYIRYIDEPCYCDYHRRDFKSKHGVDPIEIHNDHPLYRTWVDYNVGHITSFVAWAAEEAHRRGKKVSSAVFPLTENAGDRKEVVKGFKWWCSVCRFGPQDSSEWCNVCEREYALFQNWPDFIAPGYLDMVSPMNYADNPEEFALRLEREMETVQGRVPVIEGVGIWKTLPAYTQGADPATLVKLVQAAKDRNADGVCLFEYKRFKEVPQDIREEVIKLWKA